jgi:hypothetical protein
MKDTVIIEISRSLAKSLATEWIPLDDDDDMIELFEACKAVLGILVDENPYREYYLAFEENVKLCDTTGVTKETWDANQKRLDNAMFACERAERNR